MFSLQFWKSWPAVHQRFFGCTAGILILSLSILWVAYFRSPAPAITWEYIVEQSQLEVPVHSFQLGIFEINVLGDSYLLFERLIGSSFEPQPVAAHFFLLVLVISAVVILTLITTLSRFWYSIGMGLFILFIVSFRLELLQVAGFINKVPTIAVLLIFVPLSFYFHAFKTTTSFLRRFLVFSAITILIATAIFFFSRVAHPFHQLAATSYIPAIVLSVVFILMVAHEIPASFITLVSRGTRQSKSLNHFLIISAIYMVNLFLAYANKNHWIEWDFMVVNLFFLLTLSGLLGIWGFRQRQPQYEGIIEADPYGVYLFISLAAICFSTIAWLISSANDPALEALRDIIIYGHLGYGIIFITYVISNFIVMLAENLQVYKVLYKPSKMPYFTFRFAGLITTLAFVFSNTWQVPVHNAQSGYYNAQGDLFIKSNPRLAEAYYSKAALYGFRNHHSNYALANLYAGYGDLGKEKSFYKRASSNRPTEMSFLNWSQTVQRDHSWLEALLALREGTRAFPKSGAIQNTLGLMYANLGLTDSAMITLDAARKSPVSKNLAETNILGLAAIRNIEVQADSLFQNLEATHDGAKSNALAFANRQEKKIGIEQPILQDTALNLFSSLLISNYIVNHRYEPDTAFINSVINLAHKPVNSEVSEPLLFASAIALYADGQVARAFELLKEIIFYSENRGRYNNILAQWSLEQSAPDVALDHLSYSLSQHFPAASMTNAVALSEAGFINEAIVAWDTLKLVGDSSQLPLIQNTQQVLALPPGMISKLTDAEKYQYCRYRIQQDDSISFNHVAESISDEEYKARAILDRSKKLFELDELQAAAQVFKKIRGLRLRDKTLYTEIQIFDLKLVVEKGDAATLSRQLPNISFPPQFKNDKFYFETLLAANSGDVATTTKNFEWLARVNPYFEEAVVSAAEFFSQQSKEDLKAYNLLADALHVNPQSVKLLKAYSLEATRAGFSEYARNSLIRLQGLISKNAFANFVAANRGTFGNVIEARNK